jgi:hypothetical protein
VLTRSVYFIEGGSLVSFNSLLGRTVAPGEGAVRKGAAATPATFAAHQLHAVVSRRSPKDSTANWASSNSIDVICWQPKTPGQVSQLLGIGVIGFSGLRRDL